MIGTIIAGIVGLVLGFLIGCWFIYHCITRYTKKEEKEEVDSYY